MVYDLNEKYTMEGESGEEYIFSMYGFGSFDDLQEFFKDIKRPGLYVFTERSFSKIQRKHIHQPVYVGETDNYNNRNFATHHKRNEIEQMGVHSVGLSFLDGDSEELRKEKEKDILSANELLLNEVNN